GQPYRGEPTPDCACTQVPFTGVTFKLHFLLLVVPSSEILCTTSTTRYAPGKKEYPGLPVPPWPGARNQTYDARECWLRYALCSLDLDLSSPEPHLRHRVARIAFRALHFIQTFTL